MMTMIMMMMMIQRFSYDWERVTTWIAPYRVFRGVTVPCVVMQSYEICSNDSDNDDDDSDDDNDDDDPQHNKCSP